MQEKYRKAYQEDIPFLSGFMEFLSHPSLITNQTNPTLMLKCCLMAISGLLFIVNSCSPGASGISSAEVAEPVEQQQVIPVAREDGPAIKTVSHQQMLIKRAEIRLEVTDLQESYTSLKKYLGNTHAYYSAENQRSYGKKVEHEFEIRVPAAEFDSLVYLISSLGGKLEYRNISSKDVTEEYLDLTARIKTQQALEARYQELLHNAITIEDILKVEEYLTTVRENIERMQGRMVYLRDKASYSSIKLNLYEASANSSTSFTTFWAEGKRGFINGWNGLKTILLGLINIWPLFILTGLGLWLFRKSKNREGKAPTDPSPPA